MAKKSTGEIGPTKITQTSSGINAEVVSTRLPDVKEDLENYFAERFVVTFNETRPLGREVVIGGLEQNGTEDLDFNIKSTVADYIELAELSPRSESWGRAAMRTGILPVHKYARWVYLKIIKKKMLSYGDATASRTILLLYVTHWQFLPGDRIRECLESILAMEGCRFAAVFILKTDGSDLRVAELVHPKGSGVGRSPKDFDGLKTCNLAPGQHSWKVDPTAE